MRTMHTGLALAVVTLTLAVPLRAQQHDMNAMRNMQAAAGDTQAIRQVVERVAELTQAKDLGALDSLFAPDTWLRVIEGSGVNTGWLDYRDHHLGPELAEFTTIRLRHYEIEPQVRGNVAWAPFRYELIVDTQQGHSEVEGRGTAILERRGSRWLVVHMHTSGRRRAAR